MESILRVFTDKGLKEMFWIAWENRSTEIGEFTELGDIRYNFKQTVTEVE